MKKTAYLTGIFSSLLIFMGAMFKIQHWPGASIMLVLGIAGLIFVFLPIALIDHYKTTDERKNLWLHIITFITCLVVFTGALFKILHWPGAGMLIVFSIPFPFIFFLPVFIYTSNKNKAPISDYISMLVLFLCYSVFCSLLSLNVSRNIVEEGVLSAREWTHVGQSALLLSQEKVSISKENNNANLKEIENIQSSGDKLCKEISDLVKEISVNVSPENNSVFDSEGNPDYLQLNRIETLFTGDNYFHEGGKGLDVINHVRDYQKMLMSIEGIKNPAFQELVKKTLDTSPSGEATWAEMHVMRLNLIWEISSLQSIKASVRVCQSEAVNCLASK